MELKFNQFSVCSVAKWDICPGIVQIAGSVTTLESISSVLLVALWGLQETRMFLRWFSRRLLSRKLRPRFHHVSRARCNLAVSFGLCGTIPLSLVSSACVVKCKTRLFCWDSDGTRVNSTSCSNTATYTSDSADHRERYEVDQGF